MAPAEINIAIMQTRIWIMLAEDKGRVVASEDIDLYIRNTWLNATENEIDHIYNNSVYYRR